MTSVNAKHEALLDELLKDYTNPQDILGEHGLLKQLTKRVVERVLEAELTAVSVNSFLDTFGPKIRLHQPRHTVAHVSPGRVLCIHAAQSARSHCIDAETRAAPVGGPPPYQRS
jgi:pyruvate kinase